MDSIHDGNTIPLLRDASFRQYTHILTKDITDSGEVDLPLIARQAMV